MISVSRHIAVASTALTLLGGSAAAQDYVSIDDAIALLNLPVGKTHTYFNNATKIAISEECFRQDGNTVACDMRVMANKAMLDFTYQGMVYQVKGGELMFTSGVLDQGVWDTDDYRYDFKPVAIANNHGSWTASSPLAQRAADGQTIVQNDVLAISMTGDRITGCSSVPVTEYRGIDLCQSFEDKSPARAKATMVATSGRSVFIAEGETASRPFENGDWDVAVSYGRNLDRGFTTMAPYTPN